MILAQRHALSQHKINFQHIGLVQPYSHLGDLGAAGELVCEAWTSALRSQLVFFYLATSAGWTVSFKNALLTKEAFPTVEA